ncbi:hypothetical protein EHQ12_17910 [Leptospira gomenensis]|uniref:Uncharacterized protein n=1 Tax=Leptospira gomenensis TaxID=2484974 RepID=A0A5F1YTF9_9LEPT|nr:hypothetical protein [Leptospira gomenensis]TGK33213.1 hypothetical protein EHQ12_17910 [Leptospira gomenensis]TGK35554.1 hypothetical protein EHQ17_06415 [Leptospira gomenensis]TGK40878.1 hypothetical protein EHQ07_17375 [Leptospira gomenensis]TGK61168.1 hypothetical protein EHQ13_09910 [Leptospira gomenensis]
MSPKVLVRFVLPLVLLSALRCKTKPDSQLQTLIQHATVLGETKCECETLERSSGAESEEVSICLGKLEAAEKTYKINIRLYRELAGTGETLVRNSYEKKCPR